MSERVVGEVVSMVYGHQLISRGRAGGLHDCGSHGDGDGDESRARQHRDGDSLSGHEQSRHKHRSRAQRAHPRA